MNINTYKRGRELEEQHGNCRKGHPKYTKTNWKFAVKRGSTFLGYWEWVACGVIFDEGSMPYSKTRVGKND